MDDQRIVLRAALRHENFLDRLTVAGISCNAVDRLGGQGHQFTAAQQLRGFSNAFSPVGGQNFSFHFHTNHRSFYL